MYNFWRKKVIKSFDSTTHPLLFCTFFSFSSLAAAHDYKMNSFFFKCEKRLAKRRNENFCRYNILTHYEKNSNRKIGEVFVVLHKHQSNFILKTTAFFRLSADRKNESFDWHFKYNHYFSIGEQRSLLFYT